MINFIIFMDVVRSLNTFFCILNKVYFSLIVVGLGIFGKGDRKEGVFFLNILDSGRLIFKRFGMLVKGLCGV